VTIEDQGSCGRWNKRNLMLLKIGH
jgi:hypothetical protein